MGIINSHIKPALKGEVDMSDSEWTEGLKKKVASLGIATPQSNLRFASSPSGEPLGEPNLHPFLHRLKYIIYNIAAEL